VLVGSRARGDHQQGSDVDLLIDLDPRTEDEVVALHDRLTTRFRIEIEPITLPIAARAARAWAKFVDEGRVIIDRKGRWDGIKANPEAARLAAVLPDDQMTPSELRGAKHLTVDAELGERVERQQRLEAEHGIATRYYLVPVEGDADRARGLLAFAGIQNVGHASARLSAEDPESAEERVRRALEGEPFTVGEAIEAE
jgi:hypothetical protein